jgi:hypothetical protein
MTTSPNEENSTQEILSSKYREGRRHDAENIRQEFIKSKGLQIPHQFGNSLSTGTNEDEQR